MSKIKNSYYLLKETYLKFGLASLLINSLNQLLKKFKYKINTSFHQYQEHLSDRIIKLSKGKIITGLYKDVRFDFDKLKTHWNYYDIPSKLLGVYEQQVQNEIVKIKKKYGLNILINIGAGEGYHALSLAKTQNFKKTYAFEINPLGRQIIKNNILINNLENKVEVFSEGSFNSINKIVLNTDSSKILYLIDIEGGEFHFFNKNNINYFKKSYFIIEDHSEIKWKAKSILEKKFFNLVKKYFNVEIIYPTSRNPFQISELLKPYEFNEDELWLMMSENRDRLMQWLVLRPKKQNPS